MAHKKGQGSSKNGRDSNPQFRGIKLYGGQVAKACEMINEACPEVGSNRDLSPDRRFHLIRMQSIVSLLTQLLNSIESVLESEEEEGER